MSGEEPEASKVSEVPKVTEVSKCDHKNIKAVNVSDVPHLVSVKNDVYECVDCGVTILKPKESKKD